jgi:hypothetical protein
LKAMFVQNFTHSDFDFLSDWLTVQEFESDT